MLVFCYFGLLVYCYFCIFVFSFFGILILWYFVSGGCPGPEKPQGHIKLSAHHPLAQQDLKWQDKKVGWLGLRPSQPYVALGCLCGL